ncbi:uncharacterized protein LOC106134413 [Amyelois transitella]|uniref:uncharacterized protein LOC106134413 n=1 Tax=Amyelois transitella TaxID=680683 RepID=UPI00067B7B89|nr:uncharacterized protein LOC106134413 [Amyelois transitella]
MQKKICFALSLTVFCYWAESSPLKVGTLGFDNLDTDISDLKYEVEEEDLDDFAKLLEESDEISESAKDGKAKVKTLGFKRKNAAKKGVTGKKNIQDLKKFYKTGALYDDGDYDDEEEYGLAEGVAGQAVNVKGKENIKYRKGTKVKGFHRVHHKDEYKKDKEFYEDDEISGSIKKTGAKKLGFKVGAGAGFQKGHFHHDRLKGIYGKEGFANKGFFDKQFSGFADSQGFDGAFKNNS